MDHKAWAGVAFYDLIFPMFVFIVGVSLVFSVRRMIEQDGLARTMKRIFFRSVLIYIFGLLVYGGISKGVDHIRWGGVLQRVAICYFFTSLIFCAFRLRGMIVICATEDSEAVQEAIDEPTWVIGRVINGDRTVTLR